MSVKKFVSWAGEKLQFALDSFKFSVKDLAIADFGSSTGGFVDCLLQNGAKKVYSIDTAYGELAWKLRNDPRVVVMEWTNVMYISLPEKVDLVTIDTGWTNQSKTIPKALESIKKNGVIISLIKPHYEIKKARLTPEEVKQAIQKVKTEIKLMGAEIVAMVESPLLGEKGKNREFLAFIKAGYGKTKSGQ